MHQMDVDLEGEIKEREALTKQLRKVEKSLSETTALLGEAQESEESLKGQVSYSSCVPLNYLYHDSWFCINPLSENE